MSDDAEAAGHTRPEPLVRGIAHYLPQFHPTTENDEWWGPGFTEWTNVAQARPLFPGHRQPRLPGELGFYDLRLPETRVAQAELARSHNIHAFCYWHYWFGDGQRILERPFDEVLSTGEPDFPFCLAWANHTWAGVWQGAPKRLLIEQRYPGPEDQRRHFEHLLPAFHDHRYVKVDGKPLFVVYAPHDIPDVRGFADQWRTLARDAGLSGLFLVGRAREPLDPASIGFDGTISAQITPPFRARLAADRHARRRPDWRLSALTRRVPGLPVIYSYRHWAPYIPSVADRGESFPVVMAQWDNTPRTGRVGTVFVGATPDRFREQAKRAVELVRDRPPEHRLVFVHSWNEWAEGNYLEPDREHGRGFLEAFRDATNPRTR